MFSIENITANNGWAMAVAGALIVMTGLSVLSLVISQFHKVVDLIEKSKQAKNKVSAATVSVAPEEHDATPSEPADIHETAKLYQTAASVLGKEFELRKLYALAAEKQLPHPHLSIRSMREAGIIVPVGDGVFTWT